METKRTHSPLAVLSSTKPVNEIGFAALSLESDSDGWYQLLPAGHFKAVDGRPFDVASGQWFLDEPTALSLIADLKSRVNHTVIDYEHQTLLADQNGQPAPASGWIKDAQWRDSGLWIKADWTNRAAEYIKGGEYCYLSAVFPYDKQTGKPLTLHSAALVNRPGLDGLNAVALRSLPITSPASQQEDTLMDRAKLIAALGLTDAATDDDILASLKQLQDDKQTANSELATLKANPPTAQVDLTKYAPVEVVDSLKSELAALSQKATASEIEALVVDAINEGRLSNSEKDWAIQMGQQNLVALKARIQERPPIAALKGMQAGHETPPPKDDAHGLTKDELEAAKLTGKTPEQYAALKAAK